LILLVRPAGFEPATYGFLGRRRKWGQNGGQQNTLVYDSGNMQRGGME